MNRQQPDNRVPFWKKGTAAAALMAVLVAATALPVYAADSGETAEKKEQVLKLLTGLHVSGITEDQLAKDSIKSMVESVKDPYTVYMSPEDYAGFQSQLARNYIGIGVTIGTDANGIYIADTFKGSPAEEAELAVGDYILAADGHDLSGKTTSDAASFIMGKADTKVELKIRRSGEERTVTVTRREIQLPVLESHLFGGGVGYMKLYSFSSDSDELFEAQLEALKGMPGFHALVLDLRDNPGGVLDSAARIAANFIPKGTVIHTKDRAGTDEPIEILSGEKQSVPVYVLVNENSASASEVLAGALQDHGAAQVAGTRTYGKGSVQQLFAFADGSSLKLTVEEYFTPNWHPVNKVGIQPDLQLNGDLNQLFTVLRKAGVSEFRLDKTRSSISVNGVKVDDGLPAFEENGHVYIHSRVLGAMIGAETLWRPESFTVEIKNASAAAGAQFSEALGNAKMDHDLMYLDAEAFEQFFPTFTAAGTLDKLELTAGQGGK
ncbi:S41 family peptidase [Gorillibacterium sp. sgz5001074]|uniref:S41 family peptidase n=1 Tax=Gorillibacterium sp. sgz5001074 TaxID=3446695 RepID=UPI003F67E3EB